MLLGRFLNLNYYYGIIANKTTVNKGASIMPRCARIKKSEYGIYHIMERGNERKAIFLDDADRGAFLSIVSRNRRKYEFRLYAYCLMDNHVHLLINSNGSDISQIMKSINVGYVIYFNRKYVRCGHLFQDRFRSEWIEDEPYLLEVSRYIHLNPVRAKMTTQAMAYLWSSYRAYMNQPGGLDITVDTDFILNYLSTSQATAREAYRQYVNRDQEVEED